MDDRETTARSRALGAELRQLRKRDGRSATDVTKLLGWAPSTLSRLETGKRYMSDAYLIRLLGVYRVADKDFHRLLELSRKAFERSWLEIRGGDRPDERALILQETTAIKISEYDPLGIPELLRTEGYARALLRQAGLVPHDVAELWIRACLDRQQVFGQGHTQLSLFFLSEQVLRSSIGGMRVMNDQILRLVLESSQPGRTIRILPVDIGPGGLLGGPFRLMEFKGHHSIAYMQTQAASLFLEEPACATYRAVLGRLNEIALDVGASRDLLAHLAGGYDPPVEERGQGAPSGG